MVHSHANMWYVVIAYANKLGDTTSNFLPSVSLSLYFFLSLEILNFVILESLKSFKFELSIFETLQLTEVWKFWKFKISMIYKVRNCKNSKFLNFKMSENSEFLQIPSKFQKVWKSSGSSCFSASPFKPRKSHLR